MREPRTDPQAVPEDPIDPEELVAELRRLRARIPHYGQLTTQERRSMMRVAYLDPEFVDSGINAFGAYPLAKEVAGWTADELRDEYGASGRWTAVEDELTAMLQGVTAANLRRRFHIGTAVLKIYVILKRLVKF